MIRYFAAHPTAANLLMLCLLVIGLLGLPKLQRETFPDITPQEVEIRVVYPGATAEEVEESICQRIEDAIDGVKFVTEVRSDAREGVGVVVAEMQEVGHFTTFYADIDAEVDGIDDFPDDAEEPIVTQLGTTDAVLSLVVSGSMAAAHLKAYCEDLKDRLQQEQDIALVTIEGFADHQLRVELSASALMGFGLSAADVADIVARQSVSLPAGIVEATNREVLVRMLEERRTPEELEQLVIVAAPDGAEIRLRDLGRVVDTFELEEEKILLNGRRAAILNIEKNKTQDALRVAQTISDFVVEEKQRHPQMDFRITRNSSRLVVDRLQMLIKNAWQGILLVLLTLWLFFNFKLSFWVAMSLPVSFMGAFFFLPMLGMSINMLTMVAMLLALGLLMDDGIVIAENIVTHFRQGKSALDAAIDGTSEVAAGVCSSFLTTVCVLGPLVTLEGDIGKVLRVMPVVLIAVICVSLVEAFFILPCHLSHSLTERDRKATNWFRKRFDAGFEYVRQNVLGPIVDIALRFRYLTLGLVLATFLLCLATVAGGLVKFQAFPELDGDVISARLLLTPGTPLRRTEDIVDQLVEALDRVNEQFTPLQPDEKDLVETVVVEFNKNLDAFETGPHVATVTADLLTAEQRVGRIDDLVAAWDQEAGSLPGVINVVYTEPSFGPAGRPIEIRVQGPELDEISEAATEIKQWLAELEGTFNLQTDLRRGKLEAHVRQREGAFGAGMDAARIARQLRVAFQGAKVDEIQVGDESYEIDVRLRPEDQDSFTDFESFYLTLPGGEKAALSAVAEATTTRGWSRIARVNGMRTATVRGEVDTRVANTANLLALLQTEFLPDLLQRYPQIQISYEGEAKEGGQTQQSMLRAMLFGLVGVFVLLSFQFRSYLEPFVVMSAIPLTLIGVVVGHLLMGLNLSLPSTFGFVSLAGIVVNDSILLVLFLKQHVAAGQNVVAACGQASRDRFRAILLTSLTTIAGLLPLTFERSLQAQVLIPLAVSIVFGLLASTFLVLLVIPCLYSILDDLGLTARPHTSSESA